MQFFSADPDANIATMRAIRAAGEADGDDETSPAFDPAGVPMDGGGDK